MATEIKNRIVIEGEAKYKQTLREIGQALREAKSENRAASAEMKASGESMEAQQQKLDALNKVYAAQQEQLSVMQEHLERVTEAYGENSREASELRTRMNNLRAEASGAAGEIRQLSDRLDAASSGAGNLEHGLQTLPAGLAQLGQSAAEAGGEASALLDTVMGLVGGDQLISFAMNAASGAALAKTVTDWVSIGWDEALGDKKLFNKLGVTTGTSGTEDNELLMNAVEALKLLQPYISDDEAASMAASVWTQQSGTEIVTNATDFARAMALMYAASSGAGISFGTVAEKARLLATAFEGTTFEESVGLIYGLGTGQAGEAGLKVVTDYADDFADLGMNAGNASAAVESAANMGITKMPMFGKAVRSVNLWMTNLNSKTEGVKALGLAGEDLGKKFNEGGETAKAAVKLLIEQLDKVQDPNEKNELGEAIFGAEAWKAYGTKIADAILEGYGTDLTEHFSERLKAALEQSTNDVASQLGIAKNLFTGALGELFAPIEDKWTGVLKGANESAVATLENGGSAVQALGAWGMGLLENYKDQVLIPAGGVIADALHLAADEAQSAIKKAGEEAIQKINAGGDENVEASAELATAAFEDQMTKASLALDGWTEKAEETSAAPVNAAKEKIEELNTKIGEALKNGDMALADRLRAERDALIPEMMATQAEVSKAAGEVSVIITDTETGAEEKLNMLPGAANNALAGLISEFDLSQDALYGVGYSAGAAFEQGFNDALDVNSPSRVMREAAQYAVAGILEGVDYGEEDVAAGGAALGRALSSGFTGGSASAGGSAAGTGGGVSAEAMGRAMRNALAGMGVFIDGRSAGQLLERYVSEETSRRAGMTASGQSAATRSW